MSSLDTRNPNHHLNDEQLLRFADGEMTSREAEPVERHLAACWQCRTHLEDLTQTIGACVRYRKTLFDDCFPSPPAPWCDLHSRMSAVDATLGSSSFFGKIWTGMKQFAAAPRQWAPVVAGLVLAAFVVHELRDTPAVSAAALLERATVAAQSQPASRKRKIRIRKGNVFITRIAGQAFVPASKRESDSASALEAMFHKANYSWESPLSVDSYISWRNQLPAKEDSVTPGDGSYLISTFSPEGELAEATLRLSATDYQPVEGTLAFRNNETVEITDLGEVPAEAAESVEAGPALPRTTLVSPQATQAPASGSAPASSDELRVVAMLSRLGADLGEPIEISRKDGHILVTGIGIAPQRQVQIQQELASQPGVVVQFSDPATGAPEIGGRTVVTAPQASADTRQWQTQISAYLGGRANLEQFSDQTLLMMDAAMSRVHALRRLAERFPAGKEQELTIEDRRTLARLRLAHATVLHEKLNVLEQRIGQVVDGLSLAPEPAAPVQIPDDWQTASEDLLFLARQTEVGLGVLLGGAPGQPITPSHAQSLIKQLLVKISAYETAAKAAQ